MVNDILKVLPGGNCGGYGGCGFATCEACAAAIVETKNPGLCPACSQEQIDTMAEALGVPATSAYEDVAFIRCNGCAAGRGRAAGVKSCEEFVKLGFKEGECKKGCIGIGSCMDVCTFGAMSLDEDGNVVIDKEKCTGCMACENMCPQMLVQMVPADASTFIPCSSDMEEKTREICGYGCIGCGACVDSCPQEAVKLVDGHAVIDYDLCVGCIACSVKCEKKIIVDEAHDLTKLKETVAFVRCSGGKKASDIFKALGLEDCELAAKLDLKAMGLCEEGCCGIGNCTKVCRYDAIHIVDGTAVVDPEKCVGCLDCVNTCPKNLITEVPYVGSKLVACSSKAPADHRYDICFSGCIDCTDCASNCPNGAISMINQHAVVDGNICENCNVCTYVCSRGVISHMDVPEYIYAQKDVMKKED